MISNPGGWHNRGPTFQSPHARHRLAIQAGVLADSSRPPGGDPWARQEPAAEHDEPAGRVKGDEMKIVVIGGAGLIGSKLVQKLRAADHDAVPGVARQGR